MIGHANLRSGVRERLLERILSGELAPGIRINESQLSIDFGVSRTPLREALFSVERLGIVESDPRRGFFVAPLSAREVREVYPLGRALDLLAIRTAGNMPEAFVKKLKTINTAFRRMAHAPERARLADREFHRTITARCPNRRLLAMLEGVQLAMERYERVYMSDASDVIRSAKKHDEVIVAYREDRLDDVERILGDVWDYSAKRLLLELGESS